MSTILPVLTRAAGAGAAFGLGVELLACKPKGGIILTSVVTSVALRALSFYLGLGAVLGALIGASKGLGAGILSAADQLKVAQKKAEVSADANIEDMMKDKDLCRVPVLAIISQKTAGGAVVGGTLGYLVETALRSVVGSCI